MPNVERHPPGAFCWIELGTTDQEAAKNFYTSLFGWKVNDILMGPNDVYSMFQLGGRDTAAAYTLRPEQRANGVPPHWMVYVAVESADEAARRAIGLGGAVLAAPFDVSDVGRMAVLQDPTGAVFSVWQPKKHAGTGITGVDGTLCWAELSTPDPGHASQFYSRLFGWKVAADEHEAAGGYLHIVNEDEYIGGIPPARTGDSEVPPHWLLYFAVSDCDAAASRATRLGAQLYLPPATHEKVGRMAILADPEGAVFAVFQALPRA